MSPVPVIELQRRLTLVGAIRAGGEKQPKAPGRKLESFRLTSPRRGLIEQAASLYGGPVSAWKSPVGDEWQVYTEAEEIPVLVMPGYSLRQTYELWEGATKRLRLCDGVDEELSGGPCLCEAEGIDRCDLYTRLVVALPELETALGWRVISRGANAAHEMPTMLALAENRARGAPFVPAKLRLDQRRGVKDGQVVRYVVPTIDLGLSYLTLAGADNGTAALPPGRPERSHVPAIRHEPTVEEAMTAMATRTPGPPKGNLADFGPAPPAPTAAAPLPVADEATEPEQTLLASEAQKKMLNVLVGKLRGAGAIKTERVWRMIAHLRDVDPKALLDDLGGRDAQGVVHWSPLRETLTGSEAHKLIDALAAIETPATVPPRAPEERPVVPDSRTGAAPAPAEGGGPPLHYNEFPPGY